MQEDSLLQVQKYPHMQDLSHFLGKLLSFTVHRGICFSSKLRKTNPPIALCKQKVYVVRRKHLVEHDVVLLFFFFLLPSSYVG